MTRFLSPGPWLGVHNAHVSLGSDLPNTSSAPSYHADLFAPWFDS